MTSSGFDSTLPTSQSAKFSYHGSFRTFISTLTKDLLLTHSFLFSKNNFKKAKSKESTPVTYVTQCCHLRSLQFDLFGDIFENTNIKCTPLKYKNNGDIIVIIMEKIIWKKGHANSDGWVGCIWKSNSSNCSTFFHVFCKFLYIFHYSSY
jgi:hypothetical protein